MTFNTIHSAKAEESKGVNAPADFMSTLLVAFLAVEGTLSFISWLVGSASRLVGSYTSTTHVRMLAFGVACSAPLLGCCCSTYTGLILTGITVSTPCGALVVGVSLVGKLGWPPTLHPISPATAITVLLSAASSAVVLGPLNASAHTSYACHTAVLLLALRLVWTIVRVGLLMPALIISKVTRSGVTIDRTLAAMAPGEACAMALSGTQFQVTRLRLGHIDAAAIEHPRASGKWIVTFGGNGEFLECGFGSKLQLALEVLIATDCD